VGKDGSVFALFFNRGAKARSLDTKVCC